MFVHPILIIIIIIIIIIKEYKGNISHGGQEKWKDRKTRKCRSEEKVVGFSTASIFPARKREAVTQGGIIGPWG